MSGLSATSAAVFLAGLWTGINLAVMAGERYRRRLDLEVKQLRAERGQQATLVRFLTAELRRRESDGSNCSRPRS